MKLVSSWGRLSADPHQVVELKTPDNIHTVITQAALPGLAYGMGRSYGDVCLNPQGSLWMTGGLNYFIEFDEHSGRLMCEAGVLLRDIQQLMIPRGWMLPVTPGTQIVTVGGAIANDIHGKNHHRQGSFGDHVHELTLVRSDGEVIVCGPGSRRDWFEATVGGLGLTGVIAKAEIQLQAVKGPWLETETIPYADLGEFFHLADSSEADWEHTVSWVDCLSGKNTRGLFMRANPAEIEQVPSRKHDTLRMPLEPPFSLVNKATLRCFNSIYFRMKKFQAGCAVSHYESFFYPLDNLLEWNRMYGPKGFYQYQSVIPREAGNDATAAMLKEISRTGEGSFLTVLKTFGNRQSRGMLSFPRPGVTLALDFANRGNRTLKLFERLDAIVREAGGGIYPAKDARMPRDLFESAYPRLNEFCQYRDPGISSGLSRRLMGS
ncbi:MAG: FAD-binding oxidoreductase [Gammaproteobacteria bacterium]|nr:FAD-binding oxidoreductase [Gammaproteobacteria bacterium]